MKKGFLLTSVLAMALGVGVAVGAHQGQRVEQVKADAATWMINVSFDANDLVNDPVKYEGIGLNSFVFRCGKDGEGDWREQQMYRVGDTDLFSCNVAVGDLFEFNRVQIKCKQNSQDKYSKTYSISGTKETHYGAYNISFSEWTSENFDISAGTSSAPYFTYGGDNVEFVEDLEKAEFKKIGFDCDGSKTIAVRFASVWTCSYALLTTETKDLIENHYAEHWFTLPAGRYDFFFKNNNNNGGVLEVKQYGTENSYIYYVTQSTSESTDRLYTYGYDEHFGNWENIKTFQELVAAEKAEVYFADSGDVKFNYSDTAPEQNISRVCYKVPLTVGYPADNTIIITNDGKSTQTGDLKVVAGAAYVWENGGTYFYNEDVGSALDLIIDIEEERTKPANADQSICDIGSSVAASLYNRYAAFSAGAKLIVDRSKVYTYASSDREGAKTDVSYYDVVQRLGIIGKVIPAAGSPLNSYASGNHAGTIIIIIASTILATACGFFFVKRKQD